MNTPIQTCTRLQWQKYDFVTYSALGVTRAQEITLFVNMKDGWGFWLRCEIYLACRSYESPPHPPGGLHAVPTTEYLDTVAVEIVGDNPVLPVLFG